jgi:hypothetical protein
MASDSKKQPSASSASASQRGHGIRIFTYPKVIFIFPTMVAALICGTGMKLIQDRTEDPSKKAPAAVVAADRAAEGQPAEDAPAEVAKHKRFTTPQNLLAILFLGVFAFNLLIMAIDFPRFSIVGIILLALFALFFFLWIGAYFEYDLMISVRKVMASIYAFANSEFYFLIALIMAVIFAIVYVTRYLDFWEILPNEILHHHGPLSDLERFPTMNLKFDKEIPDVLEFLFLGAGRLVLHVTEERKAIVLDNVLFINSKEAALKKLMSRMEVRVTTDQEVAEP